MFDLLAFIICMFIITIFILTALIMLLDYTKGDMQAIIHFLCVVICLLLFTASLIAGVIIGKFARIIC